MGIFLHQFDNESGFDAAYENKKDGPWVSVTEGMEYVTGFQDTYNDGEDIIPSVWTLENIFLPDELGVDYINTPDSFKKAYLWKIIIQESNNHIYTDYGISFEMIDPQNINDFYMYYVDSNNNQFFVLSERFSFSEYETLSNFRTSSEDMVKFKKDYKYLTFDAETHDSNTNEIQIESTDIVLSDLNAGDIIYVNIINGSDTINSVGVIQPSENNKLIYISKYDRYGNIIQEKPFDMLKLENDGSGLKLKRYVPEK